MSLPEYLKNISYKKYDNLLDYPIIQKGNLNSTLSLNKKLLKNPSKKEVLKSEDVVVASEDAEVTLREADAEVTLREADAEVTLREADAASEDVVVVLKDSAGTLKEADAADTLKEADTVLKDSADTLKEADTKVTKTKVLKNISKVLSISPIDKYSKKKIRQFENKNLKPLDEDLINFKFLDMESSTRQTPLISELNSESFQRSNSTKFMIKDKNSQYYGIIIDSTSLKPLSIPPPPHISVLSKRQLNEANALLEKEIYDIIKIEDGTIVTLYSWIHPQNGIMWSIASNNGYDISSYKWMGKLTYAEIIYDLVDRLYPEFKTQTGMDILYVPHTNEIKTILTFTNLDPHFCYTIGFRHHNFHPMKADGEKIWQVQYVNLSMSTYTIISGGFFPSEVLPIQEKCDYDLIGKGPITINMIELKCRSSFTNAYLHINKNYIEGDVQEVDTSFSPQYGYILKNGAQSIIIKSPLLKIIEKFIYKYHKDYKIYSEKLNYLNRMKYIAMRAFLKDGKGDISTSYRQQFILLFPEWSSAFADFNKLTLSIVDKIVHLFIHAKKNNTLKANASVTNVSVTNVSVTNAPVTNDIIDVLANKLYNLIKKDYKLTENYEDVIYDYVHNPEYAFIYISI